MRKSGPVDPTSSPWLLVGFSAFGGDEINPSGLTAESLSGQTIAGRHVIALTLPVTGEAAWEAIQTVLTHVQPCWIVALGVSSRPYFSVETWAWNECDYPIPDHRGDQWRGVPVIDGAPHRVFTIAPARPIVLGIQDYGLPAEISDDPGRYVCNAVYFRLLANGLPAVFLHGPPVEGMAAATGTTRVFQLSDWSGAVRAALEALEAQMGL